MFSTIASNPHSRQAIINSKYPWARASLNSFQLESPKTEQRPLPVFLTLVGCAHPGFKLWSFFIAIERIAISIRGAAILICNTPGDIVQTIATFTNTCTFPWYHSPARSPLRAIIIASSLCATFPSNIAASIWISWAAGAWWLHTIRPTEVKLLLLLFEAIFLIKDIGDHSRINYAFEVFDCHGGGGGFLWKISMSIEGMQHMN